MNIGKKKLIFIIVIIFIVIAFAFYLTKNRFWNSCSIESSDNCVESESRAISLDQTCGGKWEKALAPETSDEEVKASKEKDMARDMYFFPDWYKKDIVMVGKEDKLYGEKAKFGEEFEIVARFMPWMTDMENVKVELHTQGGVEILEGEREWNGIIKKCEVKEFRAKAVWNEKSNVSHMVNYYITYDFPKDAMLSYINKMKDERYGNEDMRQELIESVDNIMNRDEFKGITTDSNGIYIR